MTEQAKEFFKEAQANEELKSKLEALYKSAEGREPQQASEELMQPMLVLAKEYGYDLKEEDFAAPAGELADEELDHVSGGGRFILYVLCRMCQNRFSEEELLQYDFHCPRCKSERKDLYYFLCY